MTDIHSCSYHCDKPECIKAQRDELRDRLAQPEQGPTKEKMTEALKLAQDALHMATLPFPIDEAKTLKALHAVDDVLDAMPLFNDWPGGFK